MFTQSHLTLFDPMNCSPLGSSVHGIFPARILEWVAVSSTRGSSRPRGQTHVTCVSRWILYCSATWEAHTKSMKVKSESEVTQSCPTLWDPVDCNLPGSSIHGIFQAKVLEWVAISFHRRASRPRDWTWVSRIVGRCFTIWATREV